MTATRRCWLRSRPDRLGSYDVAVPGDYMVAIMAGEGMLDSIADGELENKGNIQEQWLDVPFDAGRQHSIPYQWGSTSFSVNRDACSTATSPPPPCCSIRRRS